ncbi:hypothetical protein NP493_1119g00004 [Ridgeia piscesae]|uniref:beta-N-acetylhexosaminidase n=1 Tax=Ridgeia piscesae TaxID=27915 RepID=A0AAD9KG39_RIDPI|nr:hypothetical protein NP493_1119g00004 [Ridgeia piscesae]
MSYDKLNVFHWHVVDDQSFPYPSRTFPNLTEFGAYSPSHRYSRNDVTRIIREARLRGIRVIPEFDTPGHTHSWGKALPKLLTPCWGDGMDGGPYVPNYPLHGAAEVINPTEEYTYQVLETLYGEIVQDFPDEYVHLGLDEAYHACWKSNFEIADWMSRHNISDYSRLEEYYIRRLTDIVTSHGAKYVIWQDPVDKNVSISKDSLVVVWKDSFNGPPGKFHPWQTYMSRVTAKGHKVVLASPWYLNVISYGQDWRRYYVIEPTNFTDSDQSTRRLVQGGEATVWTEYIDGTNILPLV